MIRENFTPTPNILFDKLLSELNNSELKILLVIIRQTNGWTDKKAGKRKKRDRITHSQFIKKTRLSRRIISYAINSLSKKKLIEITDNSGNILDNASERKGQSYIYYSSLLEHLPFLDKTSAKSDTNICKKRHQPVQKVIHNKRNYNKRNLTKESRPDFVHIKEILDEIKSKWNPEIKD